MKEGLNINKRRFAFVDGSLFDKIRKLKGSDKEIKTTSRASVIITEMVGLTIHVHNGKIYVPVKVEEQMIGYRLGEFSKTRAFSSHGGDKDAARAAAAAKKKPGVKKK
jgi:small subunit ribosomal protein S19